ncbi:MAG: aspartate kinase [Nonlabens sp.]|jgi:aspartate kinase
MKGKVFKFGGASVKNAEGIKNVCKIIQSQGQGPLVVVVSAMGKTTNALEAIVEAYFNGKETAMELFQECRDQHFRIMAELFPQNHEAFALVNDLFVEIEWVLEDPIVDKLDYLYDQIVSVGELVSTRIIAAYLSEQQIATTWLDARDVILTDDTFRDALVQWEQTNKRINAKVKPLLEKKQVVLTQGFIGGTSENWNTTLGREGSDFSAAIFSYCLDVESMVIWKDVPGVLTADPRLFENVVLLDRLSYGEAIEMTYYGATVIHPKTIKPLQNKNIPMYVKSFAKPEDPGTLISIAEELIKYPPVIVVEKNQSLIHISTKDFSFVAEKELSHIFKLLDEHRIRVNMMQNMAISFSACVTHRSERLEQLIAVLEEDYNVTTTEGLELLTVRHYNEDVLQELTRGKVVLFEERIRETVQVVMKSVPLTKWKEA